MLTETDNELLTLCCEEAPDYAKIRSLIRSGADVNAVRGGNTLLSEIILERTENNCAHCKDCPTPKKDKCKTCPYGSDYIVNNELVPIVRIFLDSGFDFSSNGGKAGDNVFDALLYANYSPDVVECVRLLIDAGGAKHIKNSDEAEKMVDEEETKVTERLEKSKDRGFFGRIRRFFGGK